MSSVILSHPESALFNGLQLHGSGVTKGITVTTAPQALNCGVGGANFKGRSTLIMFNNDTVTVYWGMSSSFSTNDGLGVPAGGTAEWEIDQNVTIYVATASGTANVRVFEGY